MFRFYYIIFLNLFRGPFLIPRLIHMARHADRYTEEQRYRIVRRVVRIVARTGGIRTKVYGRENLPAEGGYIMYANHQGKWDALGIEDTHGSICAVVMDEARSHAPVTSQVLELVGGKRLKKDDIRQAMRIILEMAEEAKQGKRFLIFPEGGYDRNHNQVQEFKAGCFKSSLISKTPIVPVVLIDSYKAFEGFHIGPVRTEVHYLPPISYEEYRDKKTVEIAEMVRQRIVEKIEGILSAREVA